MAVEVHPATADRWPDMVRVFGRRGDDPSWCWCQRMRGERSGCSPARNNREALHREIVGSEMAPGLIAYDGGRPVGWTRVGPRSAVPGVAANRALARLLTDDPCAWWVTCFAVDAAHRRAGVGLALLRAAVDLAREQQAGVVEGHPVDVPALTAQRVGGSAIFTGTAAMFTAAGFTEIGRTYPTRPVMRKSLS